MKNLKDNLDKYADLAVRTGVNIQKGQTLILSSPIEAAEFARIIVKKAYEAGAKNVYVEWSDEDVTLTKFLMAPMETIKEYPMWKAKGYEEMAKEGAAFLSIKAGNPDLLKDVDPNRVSAAMKAASLATQGYRKRLMNDQNSWTLVSVPTKEWAAKVFPELSEEESMDKLWEYIFKVTRVDTENPVEAWKEHGNNLKQKLEYLNNKRYKKLYYKAPGTDLVVELPEKHLWLGGGSDNENGVTFIANMPTEEIFTLPLKNGVNGILSSTKPLSYGGNLIENFSFTFKDGKVVDFTAEKGYETLKNLIETDEGSHYLGEVALVPDDSPISNLNTIFYNTLFDENASCHFAVGKAYPTCIEGGEKMSKEELDENGVNTSLTHVDFMVGSPELEIDGETADGKREPIFRNGNWAI